MASSVHDMIRLGELRQRGLRMHVVESKIGLWLGWGWSRCLSKP